MRRIPNPIPRRLAAGLATAAILGGAGLVTGATPASAAGTPPTIDFSQQCQPGTSFSQYWTATNVDGGAHDLVGTYHLSTGDVLTDPASLAAGQASVMKGGQVTEGVAFWISVSEDGQVLATTPWRKVDLSAPGCTVPWEPAGEVEADPDPSQAPTIEFSYYCTPELFNVRWTATNVDGQAHELDVKRVVLGQVVTNHTTTLAAGQASLMEGWKVNDGDGFQVTVSENGTVLAQTPLLQVDLTEPDCLVPWVPGGGEPPADDPGEDPGTPPTEGLPIVVPTEPPTTTTTTTATTAAGSASIAQVEGVEALPQTRAQLPRTGASGVEWGLVSGLGLLAAGLVLRRQATRRLSAH